MSRRHYKTAAWTYAARTSLGRRSCSCRRWRSGACGACCGAPSHLRRYEWSSCCGTSRRDSRHHSSAQPRVCGGRSGSTRCRSPSPSAWRCVQANLHHYVVASRFDPATFAIYAVGCLQIPLVDVMTTSSANVMMVKMAEDGFDTPGPGGARPVARHHAPPGDRDLPARDLSPRDGARHHRRAVHEQLSRQRADLHAVDADHCVRPCPCVDACCEPTRRRASCSA